MSKFFDRIVATGRSELVGARLASARTAPVALQPAAPADGAVEREREARETVAPAPSPPAVVAHGPVFAPAQPFAVLAAPVARAADAPVGAGAPEPPPLVSPAAQRAVGHAQALAGAWLEEPATPRPEARAHSLPPAAASPEDRHAPSAARRSTQTVPSGDGPAHRDPLRPTQTAAAMAPLPEHDRQETAVPMRDDRGAPRANLVARSQATSPPRAALPEGVRSRSTPAPPLPIASHPAPAPLPALHIDQLEVRIVSEPPPRVLAPSAPTVRAPSQLGAWRPSTRRFLGRP